MPLAANAKTLAATGKKRPIELQSARCNQSTGTTCALACRIPPARNTISQSGTDLNPLPNRFSSLQTSSLPCSALCPENSPPTHPRRPAALHIPHLYPVSHIPTAFHSISSTIHCNSTPIRPCFPLLRRLTLKQEANMPRPSHPEYLPASHFRHSPQAFSVFYQFGSHICPVNTTSCGSLLTSPTNRANFPHAALFFPSLTPPQKRHNGARPSRTFSFCFAVFCLGADQSSVTPRPLLLADKT